VHVLEQCPTPRLRPFVERFLEVEFQGNHHDTHLPDVRPVAAFSLRGRVRVDRHWAPAAAFSGVRETLRAHEHCHDNTVFIVTFTPLGASAFVRSSLEAFTGTTTDLARVIGGPGEVDALHDQLMAADDRGQRVAVVEAFLLARIRVPVLDPAMMAAIAWLERHRAPVRIGDLTRHLGLSHSALERRFRRLVGITPKRFASVMRLRRAVALRRRGADFTAVAHAAGYFDQSHFIHDFRRATGSAPHAFFRERSS
jgi:AraC-like DNA-binding protein